MYNPTALIIGAGPAGLTAAIELLEKTDIRPVILEQLHQVGGISRTVRRDMGAMDIGGHRFFSKDSRVVDWWLGLMPLDETIPPPNASGLDEPPRRMLLRRRRSRIYWRGNLLSYPLRLDRDTLGKLGLRRTFGFAASYLWSRIRPHTREDNLEQFLVNRFGRRLYEAFFRSYTEKVWGVPCDQIAASWGLQRIKGLSVGRAIRHALASGRGAGRRNVETSLIDRFMYPCRGPGQLWELAADKVRRLGGKIVLGAKVTAIRVEAGRVASVTARLADGETRDYAGEHVLSSMPVRDLLAAIAPAPPPAAREVAQGLVYRDFIAVGLLAEGLRLGDQAMPPDNWIYVQQPNLRLGRIQIYNNWSPYMVADVSKVWMGLEYFCTAGDELWTKSDAEMISLATDELAAMGAARPADVHSGLVIRQAKAYPAYFGTYGRFGEVRRYLDTLENLYCVGRNGTHRYNNMDHSMLTAMAAVEGIAQGRPGRDHVWNVNAEGEYIES